MVHDWEHIVRNANSGDTRDRVPVAHSVAVYHYRPLVIDAEDSSGPEKLVLGRPEQDGIVVVDNGNEDLGGLLEKPADRGPEKAS